MECKHVALVINSDIAPLLYQSSIDEYNSSQKKAFYIITQHVKSRNDFIAANVPDDALLFVDFDLEDGHGMALVEALLQGNPQLHVLILCEPKDLKETGIIEQWSEAYPLAVIGRVIKPIQPSAIWAFLESTEKALPRFDMTAFDWNEEWGDTDGME